MKQCLFLLVISILFNGFLFAQPRQMVEVKLGQLKRPVPEIGFNLGSLTKPSWDNVRFRDSTLSLGLNLLRYPGGTESQYFDWKTGKILPISLWQNGTLSSFRELATTPHLAHNLAQLKSFTDYAKVKPVFCLNVTSSSLSDQLMMLKQAKSLGLPVEFVELGHELYAAEQDFTKAFPSPSAYANEMKKWADSIRFNFPLAKIAAIGATKDILLSVGKPMPLRVRSWNDALIQQNLNVQAFTLHNFFRHNMPLFGSNFQIAINASFTEWDRFKKFAIDSIPKSKEIWITEYNIADSTNTSYTVASSWMHGLFVANIFNQMLEQPQITMMLNHQVSGPAPYAALASNTFFGDTVTNKLTAAGNALRLYHQAILGKESAQQLDFDQNISTFIGVKEYKLLSGWIFTNAKDTALTLLNLSNKAIELKLSNLLPRGFSFEHITFVSLLTKNLNTKNLNRVVGNGQETLLIPPYSLATVQSPAKQLPPSPNSTIELFRDIPYARATGVDQNLLNLDIHTPIGKSNKKPVVMYVHDGDWASGDKMNIGQKDDFFTDLGFIFVSINHRLSPSPADTNNVNRVKFPTHAEDVAQAISWVYQNIANYGGDPEKISLMGTSAGGHLVSLISTDESYLKKHNLGLEKIKCTCSLDDESYDIPYYLDKYAIPKGQTGQLLKYVNAFTANRNTLVKASPINYIQTQRYFPDFLVFNQVASERIDMADRFLNAVKTTKANWSQVYTGFPLTMVDQFIGTNIPAYSGTEEALTNFFLRCLKNVATSTRAVVEVEPLFLYPNPSRGMVYLDLGVEKYDISIFNQMGQLLKTFSSATGMTQIDVTALPKGIYLVQGRSKEKIRTGKLILE
jgi:acetyl esterase/lipase